MKSPKVMKQLGTLYLADQQPNGERSSGIKPFDGSKMTLAISPPSFFNQSNITNLKQGILSTPKIKKESTYIEKPMSLGRVVKGINNDMNSNHNPLDANKRSNLKGMTKANGII